MEKRFQKEMKDLEERPELYGKEAKHWTLSRLTEPGDAAGIILEATLRPAHGAFVGGRFCWELCLGRDYPFKPPKRKLRWCGVVLAFKDVVVGMEVCMTPEGVSALERRTGRVIEHSLEEGRARLEWSVADGDAKPGMAEVSQEWWDGGASAVLSSGTVFHPRCNPTGEICGCCARDRWSPACTIPVLLTFLRQCVEEATDSSECPFQFRRSENWSFCNLNGHAAAAMRQDRCAWLKAARAAFFGGNMLLSVLVASAGPGEVLLECRAMSGKVLAQLQVHPEDKASALLQRTEEMVPSTAAWCRPVLPDGRLLEEVPQEQTVAELFGL